MQVLMGATLIDGTGAPPLPRAVVVVNGGRIEAVGPEDSISIPPDAEVLDLAGLTLLPGLIDCHDHLASQVYDLAARWGLTEPMSLRHLRAAEVLLQTLATGYTAVRDAGRLDIGFKLAVEEGLVPGPRLVLSVSAISGTGGLGDWCSPSGHRYPGSDDPNVPTGVANGVDEVRAKVRELVRVGADVIKCATTGGASTTSGHGPKDLGFGLDEMKTLVLEANALGRRVMCHALGGPRLRIAIEAGVNSIEHGTYLDEDPGLAHMMAEKSIFYVPTFSVYVFHGERGTPHGQARARELRPHHVESLRLAMEAGVKVVAGTDAGGWVHGNNAQELGCLVEAGMSPMQAIQAATGVASECLGLKKQIGTVEAGKLADLVAVEGNPLEDITILQQKERIKLVLKGGEAFVNRVVAKKQIAVAGGGD